MKNKKINIQFKTTILYSLSILTFFIYLLFEYNKNINLNYFIRLIIVASASIFIIIGDIKTIKNKKITKFSLSIIFIYYIIFITNMVFFTRINNVNSYNLIPFKSIIEIFQNNNLYSIIINIFGNLLIFMPLEYFIIELFKIHKLIINFILSFIIVLIIEIVQLIFKIGVFDVDDLILCTLGMIIFYIVYSKIRKYPSI